MRYAAQVAGRCDRPIRARAPRIECTVIIQTEAFYCFSEILMFGTIRSRSDAGILFV